MGVVLCGGESTRMGSDKALLQINNQTLVERSIQLFSQLCLAVGLSVNMQQYQSYRHLSSLDVIADNETINVKGPLLGLLSVHEIYPNENLFVLACDLANMNIKVLNELCDNYHKQPGKDVHVFMNNDEYEPLCGIYTSAGLNKIKRLLEQEGLRKFSMKHVIETLNAATYPLPDDWKDYFINVNTKEDLYNLQLKR